MLVHCGLESPPLRARVVALQSHMVLAARLRYTWLEWEPEEKVADRKHRVVSALLCLLVYYFFLQKFLVNLSKFASFSPLPLRLFVAGFSHFFALFAFFAGL
jgi:hypothetical protein